MRVELDKKLKNKKEIALDILDRCEKENRDEIIYAGIGTDKDIMDCLGCLVGTMVSEKLKYIKAYGTLEYPIHALNIRDRIDEINKKHPNAFIVGVDACLSGDMEEIGLNLYRDKPISAGKGVGKKLPQLGDVSIVSILGDVNSTFGASSNARLFNTYKAAKDVFEIIKEVDKLIKIKNIKLNEGN